MSSFDENNAPVILEFLNEQVKSGFMVVAFPEDDRQLGVVDLVCFKNSFDVMEYCFDNSTDYDVITFRTISGLQQNLQTIIDGQNLVAEEQAKLIAKQNPNIAAPNMINSTLNKSIMDEKTLAFNEGQLLKVGMKDAFTPELQMKMEQGIPLIQHDFKKIYDRDHVHATLYLKKSETSGHYFLNKFDLSLQKEGETYQVSQTFYLNWKNIPKEDGSDQMLRRENKYTLKEGYNLLSGRPVFKDLITKEGAEYQAWIKLDFKNKLSNGNYAQKQYTNNYGFDLEKVLAKYSISEMFNEQYKRSLIDSLHRGNLQKATFIDKDGKEEKLFVSPNISVGALNIYDMNKRRVPTEALIARQFVGKEPTSELKQKEVLQEKPVENLKQDVVQNEPQKIQEKKTPQQKQKGSSLKKNSSKQKM